jgi:hypothetical protein
MTGDEIVSLLVCLSLLSGLVAGLRYNVRMLAWLCGAVVIAGLGLAAGGVGGIGRDVLMATMAIVALQVGYFVALVIGAMRLVDTPVAVREDAPVGSRDLRSDANRPRRA